MIFYQPQNFKKGRLVAGRYRILDIIILCMSFFVTFVAEIAYLNSGNPDVPVFLLLLLPFGIGLILTFPLGIYHNLLVFLLIYIRFLRQKKQYIWAGIIHSDEIED